MSKSKRSKVGEKFFWPIGQQAIEKILPYLSPIDVYVLVGYGKEYKGEKQQLLNEVNFSDFPRITQRQFRDAKFHLAAYRLLHFPYRESQSQKGNWAKRSLGYKSLVNNPDKLERIAKWIREVDELRKRPLISFKNSPKTPQETLELKLRLIQKKLDYIFAEK